MVRKKKFRAPKVSTVIGKGTEVKGDVVFQGGLHIDGSVTGNVTGDQDATSAVTLSEQGRIEGDVRVANVILNGTVVGDVYALQRVELAPQAKISGTVYYQLLEMAMGAEVNGQLVHAEQGMPPQLEYDEKPALGGSTGDGEANASETNIPRIEE